MAEIIMSYILIEKEMDDEAIEDIVLFYLKQSGLEYSNEGFKDEKSVVSYKISHKSNSQRAYLELKTSSKVDGELKLLQKLDDCLLKLGLCKYAEVIRDYDGVSAVLCERLYKHYATFERRIRQLILLVLTKSFGCAWREKTVSESDLKTLMKKSKGSLSLTDTLEQFDLKMMEDYLFKEREIDYKDFISKRLSEENLKNLSKEEICQLINQMRPKCLWDMFFGSYGLSEDWKRRIEDIHECRNRVAHHKRISIDEYKKINLRLKVINKDLIRITSEIKVADFSNESAVAALGNFIFAISDWFRDLFSQYDISGVIAGINSAVQRIGQFVFDVYKPQFAEGLSSFGNTIAKIAMESVDKPEVNNSLKDLVDKQRELLGIPKDIAKGIPPIDIETLEIVDQVQKIADESAYGSLKKEIKKATDNKEGL